MEIFTLIPMIPVWTSAGFTFARALAQAEIQSPISVKTEALNVHNLHRFTYGKSSAIIIMDTTQDS